MLTHVYLWQIHFDIWQSQYNIVKLNKIKFKKKTLWNKLKLYKFYLTTQVFLIWIFNMMNHKFLLKFIIWVKTFY